MSRNKATFDKGYMPNFDNEIIQIEEAKASMPPYGAVRYSVKDQKGEPFDGYFYEPDLTKVRRDEQIPYRIEKELKRRKNAKGKLEYYVKFYSDPVAQWIDESHLL
jgi:hypothetical protein